MSYDRVDTRFPNAGELIHSKRLALLLGDEPGPLPNWFERELGLKPGGPCELDEWQKRLVREYHEVVARRAAQAVRPHLSLVPEPRDIRTADPTPSIGSTLDLIEAFQADEHQAVGDGRREPA